SDREMKMGTSGGERPGRRRARSAEPFAAKGGQPVLVMATRNENKRRELAVLLRETGLDVRGPEVCPEAPREVEETGATFHENALLKARALAIPCRVWALADDSGLAVDALGGEPGVRSARF